MKTTIAIIGILLLSVTTPLVAKASPLQVSMLMSGTVSEIQDENGLLSGGIQVGDSISGTLTIPVGAQNTAAIAGMGIFPFTSGAAIAIQANNLTFKTDSADPSCRMEVLKAATEITGSRYDSFMFRSAENLPLNSNLTVDEICWQLTDPTSTALSEAQMPSFPLQLSSWQSRYGLMISGVCVSNSDLHYFIRATVTNLWLAQ
jgi:hypothetical protein